MSRRISPRTELCLAAFHYAHGTAASYARDHQRLHHAVDAVTLPDLPGRYDKQLLQACMRATICASDQVAASRVGINEILTLACADKSAAGDDAAALELGMKPQPNLSWQDRADLR